LSIPEVLIRTVDTRKLSLTDSPQR